MTDLEKYKQLFNETNVKYRIEEFEECYIEHSLIRDAILLTIESDFLGEDETTCVNDGYTGFFCNLVFNNVGKLLKFGIYE